MKNEILIAPKNSIILIMDRTIGKVPESMNGKLVAATSSCVAVGTLSEYDGDTLITLSEESDEIKFCEILAFAGRLNTPNKIISVCMVPDEPLLEYPVSNDVTRIKIWVNDKTEPDKIQIVIEPYRNGDVLKAPIKTGME